MTKDMTSGSPARLITSFSVPLIIGNIFQQFYSMADTLIVGRTIGVNALAAVGCTGSISFFILGFIMGMTSGLSIITAQRFGARDFDGIKRSFATGILISIGGCVIMTLISVPLARPFLTFLQTPEELIDDACSYIIIIFCGIGACVLFNLLSNMLRSLGDSRTPLLFLIAACIINIVLDFLFILVFSMGVAGAGWATVLAQLISGLCCVIFIRKKVPALWLTKKDFAVSFKDIQRHLNTALPMAFQMSIIAIGSLILQFALNGLGTISVAAYTAAQKIDAIATMPLNSFGATMTTYAAQNYGAKQVDRIRTGVFQCILISCSFSIVMGIIMVFGGYHLVSIFIGTAETEVLSLAQTYLSINGRMYWILALLFIYRFTLQGLGQGLIPTIAGVMELIMRAFAGIVLTQTLGFVGASISSPLAWIGACIPLVTAYYFTMHKLMPKPLPQLRKI